MAFWPSWIRIRIHNTAEKYSDAPPCTRDLLCLARSMSSPPGSSFFSRPARSTAAAAEEPAAAGQSVKAGEQVAAGQLSGPDTQSRPVSRAQWAFFPSAKQNLYELSFAICFLKVCKSLNFDNFLNFVSVSFKISVQKMGGKIYLPFMSQKIYIVDLKHLLSQNNLAGRSLEACPNFDY